MRLGDYLSECGTKVRKTGEHDCATFPANWIKLCGSADPLEKWRGQYSSEEEAEAIIERGGGLVALFDRALATPPVDNPKAGDVAVISLLGEEAGSIYTGERWAVVADRGLAFTRLSQRHVCRVWRP